MANAYALSVILSAFLLFQIQPMIAKFILPWFGGTSAVWSTVLLFFQCVLTGGYAYAYWLLGRLRGRQQGIVHLVFLAISLGLLATTALVWPSPLMPNASWRPVDSTLPVWGILRLLAVAVGVPYFLLASNSTLMQAWFGQEQRARTPYRLYALSNAGSLAALVSYPLVFEPLLTLRTQAYLWTAGYAAFAVFAAALAVRAYRRHPATPDVSRSAPPEAEARPGLSLHLLWAGLAAVASALLISVTSQTTQEVAAVPFLWVVPLSIYLLTFILAFSGGRGYSRRVYRIAFFGFAFLSVWMLAKSPPFSILSQMVIYAGLLFVAAMICHCELYSLRPPPRSLPSFYLMVAVGGALGGIFVNLVAPFVFPSGFWELQWAVVACGVLLTIVVQRERPAASRRRQRKAAGRSGPQGRRIRPEVLVSSALLLLLSGLVVALMAAFASSTLTVRRGFYGVLRVWEINTEEPALRAYQLTHGRTVHGFQFEAGELRDVPTTYYAETSGVGLALLNHPARPASLRVGGLGLGIGVIAHYAQPGDVFRFYEINPDMIRLAEGDGGFFSFLSGSKGEAEVVAGDARLTLERELSSPGPQDFDVLVLDAFSGDAVPLHLLTREAFEVYLQHLAPDGVLAVNVSNRYFDLGLQVYRLAEAFGLQAMKIEDRGDGLQSYDSIWMLLARDRSLLDLPALAARAAASPAIPASLRLWTDDYSNLLQVLR
jgi:SAM-dependent methyltransferase